MILAVFLYAALLIASASGTVVGVVTVAKGFARYRQAVTITDTPLSSPDAVAVGPAAVSGTVSTGSPLAVPVIGGDCVAYDLSVRDSGYGSSRRPLSERRVASFSLETESGRIEVSPEAVEAAEFDLSEERRAERTVESYENPPEQVVSFERTRNLPERGMQYDRTFDLAWIEPGDELYAFGRVDANTGLETDGGTAGSKGTILRDGDVTPFFSDKPPEELLRERRFGLVWSVCKGLVVATVSLVVFLWLSGIAPLFLL
ncbi:hypothetical protein [Natrialba swarupiae]|uniref:RING-type E3 ubiquitin transferase n=1 Tax=Natrialba swarupiae TaxID=2448032 RepID=A0A5D5AUG1_9EURY|nr:hypothetical protein [Natrialba swarupiae]TYT63230.1 hypothetical protein FYC77_03920 [Natrialba swarupiae]